MARVERINPAVNAVVTLDRDAAFVCHGPGRRADRGRRTARAAARPADHDQGRHRGRWPAVDRRLDRPRRPYARGRCPGRRPSAFGPRRRVRQDQRARVVGRYPDVQLPVRGDRNPWDPTRTSGGSSGGPAVAVATGMSSFELGTESADRSVSHRATAGSAGTSRASAWCPRGIPRQRRRGTLNPTSTSSARSPGRSGICPCSWTLSPDRMPTTRWRGGCPCPGRATSHCPGTGSACGWTTRRVRWNRPQSS